jgi:hypothetical protein
MAPATCWDDDLISTRASAWRGTAPSASSLLDVSEGGASTGYTCSQVPRDSGRGGGAHWRMVMAEPLTRYKQ